MFEFSVLLVLFVFIFKMTSIVACHSDLDHFVMSFSEALDKAKKPWLIDYFTGAVELLDEQNNPCFSITLDPLNGPDDIQFTSAMNAKSFFQKFPVSGVNFVRVNKMIAKKLPLSHATVMANVYQLVYKPIKN